MPIHARLLYCQDAFLSMTPVPSHTTISNPPASRATWIWYPGDFEIWLSNRVQTRRVERDISIPPFWRMDSHNVTVSFI